MAITEEQLRGWIVDQYIWSRFFQRWLETMLLLGRAERLREWQLQPIIDQLEQERGEDHPAMLLAMLDMDPPEPDDASPEMTELIAFVEGHFENLIVLVRLLYENEALAAKLYVVMRREGADIEGVDWHFVDRHIELDEGEHAEGARSLLALAEGRTTNLLLIARFVSLRLAHLQRHFGDQIATWFD